MRRFLVIAWLVFQVTLSFGQIKLPRLIRDGVVFQRDVEIKMWGWSSPGESIALMFNDRNYTTRADKYGRWQLVLPPQNAGGPYDLTLKGKNMIKLTNILIGDVWVCSGQSNMELTMERVKEKYADIIATSENQNIRQFLVPDQYDFNKVHNDLEGGSWEHASPKNILSFSAVAYFFAREVYEKYHVPIGLINASLGGSPAEAWMSEDALIRFKDLYQEAQRFKDDEVIRIIETEEQERTELWYEAANLQDMGRGQAINPESEYHRDGWKEMPVPGYWTGTGAPNENGTMWFKKDINIPKSMVGKRGRIWLGRIVDQDSVYINGKFVGTTGYQYPPRRYEFADDVLKEGSNTIVIRIINPSGRGGFVPDKPYFLSVDSDTLDLKGLWQYKRGATMSPLPATTAIRWKPTGLYNSMIAPLTNFSIKGVIWYQGEGNTLRPAEYKTLFPALIRNWRDQWKQGDFPFLFVQLANFMDTSAVPQNSQWAALRQAQWQTLLLKNTGMAVAIDLGEWNDIHPLNKREVGRRLALQARRIAYHENTLVASGPQPNRQAIFGVKDIVITFKNVTGDLVSKDGKPLQHFAISQDGKTFVWANAKIVKNTVVVSQRGIRNPVAIRYAWADNPVGANLANSDGLPATPFQLLKTSRE